MERLQILFVLIFVACATPVARALDVHPRAAGDTFPIVWGDGAAPILVDPDEAEVVREVAAEALAVDIARVSGKNPALHVQNELPADGPAIIIGTVNHSSLIESLVAEGLLDIGEIEGEWEKYMLTTLDRSGDGTTDTLVIVGSDRRAAAYGVFELSEAMGVSPWYWWADVPIQTQEQLHVSVDSEQFGPPKVKYRGIFLNDEGWGLNPWAAKTYEPEVGDIGPKTYAAIFELLLRLKANYIWPAMHPCTLAFNQYPDNKLVAERYAIVMGSSHAEPMLRNNVTEWAIDGEGDWNFQTNRDRVVSYWETRVQQNAQFENVYTIGMRGIHDSRMQSGGTLAERAATLEEIFRIQRDMLQRHTGRPAHEVPQVLVPYKEVLEIYNHGLDVPEDVILGWVDDNFGYIRKLSNAEERARAGGSGVYYHLSYWGRPHDYLWLCTTPLALTWEEMTKAYAYGADDLWVVNVGDIKPSEIGMSWFLDLAWDPEQYGPTDNHSWLVTFFSEIFGSEYATSIADLKQRFYLLHHERKPEFMAWTSIYPNEPLALSEFTPWAHGDELRARLGAFDAIQGEAELIYETLPESQRDAFFQLVLYPVRASANMNRKFLYWSLNQDAAIHGWPIANHYADLAVAAYEAIQDDTAYYNQQMSNGKWMYMIESNPRALEVFNMPAVTRVEFGEKDDLAVRVEGKIIPARSDGGHQKVPIHQESLILMQATEARASPELHRIETDRGAILMLPQVDAEVVQPADGPARADFAFEVSSAGRYILELEVNHPSVDDDSWYIRMNSGAVQTFNDAPTDGQFRWLEAGRFNLEEGLNTLTVIARENGAQLRAIRMRKEGLPGGYESAALTNEPNRLPTLNRYTQRSAFIDLYTTGRNDVQWQATSSEDWVQLSESQGKLDGYSRLQVSIDFNSMPKGDLIEAQVHIQTSWGSYTITVPTRNPDLELQAGTFIEENSAISIPAERFSQQLRREWQGQEIYWDRLEGTGYTGSVMFLQPWLIKPERLLVPGHNAPELRYRLRVFEGGSGRIIFRALPTHEINEDHELVAAFSIAGQTQQVQFVQGNHEHSAAWSVNVLRDAMQATAPITLDPGEYELIVYGLDPSVVLDRIVVEFEDGVAPWYTGPRETRIERRD